MKKRKRLGAAIIFWLASVGCMTVLLVLSFGTYLQLNMEVKQIKQELVMLSESRQHSGEADAVTVLANEESDPVGTKETEQPRDLSLKGISDKEVSDDAVKQEASNANASVGEIGEDNTTEKQAESDAGAVKTVYDDKENAEEKTEEVTLLFAGDLLLSGAILRQYAKNDNEITGLTEEGLLNTMNSADIFMVNHEFPFSDRGEPMENKEYTFRAPLDKTNILGELGIDIVSLANNHTLDYGTDALMDTFTALDDAGVAYVGAGENLDRARALEIIEVGGKKIGFLAASRVIPVTNWNATDTKPGMLTTYDPTRLLTEIEAAEDKCDFLVVYVHWGLEYKEIPEDYQVTMAKQYIDAGADAVIGSHPHVVQGVSYYKDKIIAYSLGNFIFGNTIKQGMMLELTLDTDGEVKAELIPYYSPGFQLKEMSEEAEQEFFKYITEISFNASVDENGLILPLQ